MRVAFLSSVFLVVAGVMANPVKEESMMTVGVEEKVVSDGDHFIVSVQR
jgi:hypothetical protein